MKRIGSSYRIERGHDTDKLISFLKDNGYRINKLHPLARKSTGQDFCISGEKDSLGYINLQYGFVDVYYDKKLEKLMKVFDLFKKNK